MFCLGLADAQAKTGAISNFKMQLFLDKDNVLVDNDICTKNDSLYYAFSKNISLKLDTLQISGNYDFTMAVFAPKFEFYTINISSVEKNIYYIKKMTERESNYLGIPSGKFSTYVLAINLKNGRSYRILGFNGNDFLGYLSDYIEYFNENNDKKINAVNFLKNYQVEDIDFKCLYTGLHSKIINRKKYPCLQRVNDPIVIH